MRVENVSNAAIGLTITRVHRRCSRNGTVLNLPCYSTSLFSLMAGGQAYPARGDRSVACSRRSLKHTLYFSAYHRFKQPMVVPLDQLPASLIPCAFWTQASVRRRRTRSCREWLPPLRRLFSGDFADTGSIPCGVLELNPQIVLFGRCRCRPASRGCSVAAICLRNSCPPVFTSVMLVCILISLYYF